MPLRGVMETSVNQLAMDPIRPVAGNAIRLPLQANSGLLMMAGGICSFDRSLSQAPDVSQPRRFTIPYSPVQPTIESARCEQH